MRRLVVFNHMSLDGYFTDANGDMSFAHNKSQDPEWDAFVADNAGGGGMLVFGRITYEMMASFWPTPAAAQSMPVVAERMNNLPKIVFSRTLHEVRWSNTTLVKGDPVSEMRRMKGAPGEDMTILGSGTIVSMLAPHGLIDEFQIIVNPVVLGAGRTMFEGVPDRMRLQLAKTRSFRNGDTLLCYEPIG